MSSYCNGLTIKTNIKAHKTVGKTVQNQILFLFSPWLLPSIIIFTITVVNVISETFPTGHTDLKSLTAHTSWQKQIWAISRAWVCCTSPSCPSLSGQYFSMGSPGSICTSFLLFNSSLSIWQSSRSRRRWKSISVETYSRWDVGYNSPLASLNNYGMVFSSTACQLQVQWQSISPV